MKINFIDLQKQYQRYKEEFNREIGEVLNSSSYILGKKVEELENLLAEYVRVKFGVGYSSGTDGLLSSLMAYGIKPGDEIITTPFTFVATAEVISLLGAKPVFADIDEKTYNISPKKLKEKITEKTKGIIAVSLYGQCAEFDEINKIAEENNLFVIEDACQSFGASYKGKKSCGLTDISVTSFYPSKPLGCYGDGGMVFTNDENIYKKLKMLRNHGQEKTYKHDILGINGRLDTIQAAVLVVKFRHFEEALLGREKAAEYYNKNLSKNVVIPYIENYNTSVYAQYSIRVKEREKLASHLKEKNIPVAIHYPIPLHLQKVFNYLGYKKGDFQVSEKVSEEILSLPFFSEITQEEQGEIINSINEFV